jgi:hypothetical protein
MGVECQRQLGIGVAAFTPAHQPPTFRPAP